ncbi:MAG: TIGR00153 family protein [Deltaproteobacteria bacterium]|nr:TIGR00153 family protein [Deltaproteobacteria bacterium]
MSWIQNLFRSSPIKPMQEHMRAAVACAVKIEELFEAMTYGDREAIARVRREIDELEHEADRIKNEIRANLPGRLLLAMERRDMLAILEAQDDIADMAQDIAGLADQRGMMTPEALREPMLALVAKTLETCRQAETIVNELDELVEAGFKGREVTRVEEMIASLARIESDTDQLAEAATRRVFSLESELGVSTVYWWHMVDWVSELADAAEKIGNRLRLLIAN